MRNTGVLIFSLLSVCVCGGGGGGGGDNIEYKLEKYIDHLVAKARFLWDSCQIVM